MAFFEDLADGEILSGNVLSRLAIGAAAPKRVTCLLPYTAGSPKAPTRRSERGESAGSASHSDDSAKCYPLKVEVHRPRESALAGWQSPPPNEYSRSHGVR